MTCPKCTEYTDPTTDQLVIGGAATASGLFIVYGGIFGIIAAPYLAPVAVVGFLWHTCRKVTCPNCGHSFTCFQGGKP